MTIASHSILTLAEITEAFKASSAVVESFVVGSDAPITVRLIMRDRGIELVFDIETKVAPDGTTYHLDPFLTIPSCLHLMNLGVLPRDTWDAHVQGSGLALEIAIAHRRLIAHEISEFLAYMLLDDHAVRYC